MLAAGTGRSERSSGRRFSQVRLPSVSANLCRYGVDQGQSFEIATPETLALGVDPNPCVRKALKPNQRVFAETSDDFFDNHDVIAELGGKTLELAFIDGMHQFEIALRDTHLSSRQSAGFTNLEVQGADMVAAHHGKPRVAPRPVEDRVITDRGLPIEGISVFGPSTWFGPRIG